MNVVGFDRFRHYRFIKENVDVYLSEEMRILICEDIDGTPVGAVVFEDWTKNSVHAHISVTKKMALRSLVPESLHYVFNMCGRKTIYACVKSDNRAAIILNEKLGFEHVHTERDYYDDGVHSINMKLKRENCNIINQLRRAA